MKKLIIICILIAMMGLTACTSATNETNPSNDTTPKEEKKDSIQGGWIEEGRTSEYYYIQAVIDDKTITVYNVSNDGQVWTLYWSGSYVAPENPTESYTWISKNNLVETAKSTVFYPRASHDETKEFKYENGAISFWGKSGGNEYTAILKPTDKILSECKEEAAYTNNNKAVDFSGSMFTASKTFREFAPNDSDSKYTYYYSPNAILMLNREMTNGVSEEMFRSDEYIESFIDGMAESLNNGDTYNVECYSTERITVNKHPGVIISFSGTYMGYEVRLYYAVIVNGAKGTMPGVLCTVAKNARFDYLSDLKEMLQGMVEETYNWELGYYVDEFGDPTTNPYVVGTFDGDFSNSFTQNSKMTALIYLDKKAPNYVSVRLFDYGYSRVNASDTDVITLKVKLDDGTTKEYTLEALSGDVECYDASLVEAILKNQSLSWLLTIQPRYSNTPDTYRFKTDNYGLQGLFDLTK